MSDTVIPQRTHFGHKLRQELNRQNRSLRSLAKTLAPEQPEQMRRNLSRWIGGHNQPTPAHRRGVAVALGLSPDYFDPDDEEDDQVMDVLTFALRQMVRQEVQRSFLNGAKR